MNPLAYLSDIGTVFSKLLSKPSLILKPKSTFLEEDPFFFLLFLFTVLTVFLYIQTKLRDNLSWVDRLWSIMPPIYAGGLILHALYHIGVLNHRLVMMFMLQTCWGIRLTYNLYIKNGYSKLSEDYRWEQIRTWFNGTPIKFELFILFINVIAQQFVIFGFSALPTYIVYKGALNKQTGTQHIGDLVCFLLFIFFFVIETIADYQMFEFQQLKKKTILSREFSNIRGGVNKGFFQDGLYRYARHPNYFGELGIWLVIYLFSCIVAPLNWSIIGYLSLLGIFAYSINLTEEITTFKYPPYKYYAKQTNCLIPWFPSTPPQKKKQ